MNKQWLDAINRNAEKAGFDQKVKRLRSNLLKKLRAKRRAPKELIGERVTCVERPVNVEEYGDCSRIIFITASGVYCCFQADATYGGVILETATITIDEGFRFGLIDEDEYKEYADLQQQIDARTTEATDKHLLEAIIRRQGINKVREMLRPQS